MSLATLEGMTTYTLRLMTMALSVLAIVGEFDTKLLNERWAPILRFWIPRGLLHFLVAMLTSEVARDKEESIDTYSRVSAILMLVSASIYICGGLLCFGQLKRKRQESAEARRAMESEYEELRKRQLELERHGVGGPPQMVRQHQMQPGGAGHTNGDQSAHLGDGGRRRGGGLTD